MKQWIRDELKEYKPYNASEPEYKIKLNANESPFGLPKVVKKNIVKWLEKEENLNLYPDTDCIELKEELAKFYTIKRENIICGVGSDQLIEYICKVFLEPNDIVILPSPSFSMYALTTELNKGKVIKVELDKNFVQNIIKVCTESNPKLLFLCNPNNPTGTNISCNDIEKILKEVNCPVIIDEAYAEFSNQTMIPYIKKYKNIIVLRTFSKAYGLAGLRIGYGIADKEFIDVIEIVKAPYNINTFSQKVAVEVLKNVEIYKNRIEYIKSERDWLFEQLKHIKEITAYPSDANFIYVSSKINIAVHLYNKGILIRELKPVDGMNFSRITVGNRKQNEKLVNKMKKIFKG